MHAQPNTKLRQPYNWLLPCNWLLHCNWLLLCNWLPPCTWLLPCNWLPPCNWPLPYNWLLHCNWLLSRNWLPPCNWLLPVHTHTDGNSRKPHFSWTVSTVAGSSRFHYVDFITLAAISLPRQHMSRRPHEGRLSYSTAVSVWAYFTII